MAKRNQASFLPLPSAVTTRKSGSASDGAERGEQHPGGHRQGHGQGREDNSKAGVQQSAGHASRLLGGLLSAGN